MYAKRIAGDHAEVTCLVPAGVTESHDWEPSHGRLLDLQRIAGMELGPG